MIKDITEEKIIEHYKIILEILKIAQIRVCSNHLLKNWAEDLAQNIKNTHYNLKKKLWIK